MTRDEAFFHHILQFRPCGDRVLTTAPPTCGDLVLSHYCVVGELHHCKPHLLLLCVVVAIKYKLDPFLPLPVGVRVRFALECRQLNFDSIDCVSTCFGSISSPSCPRTIPFIRIGAIIVMEWSFFPFVLCIALRILKTIDPHMQRFQLLLHQLLQSISHSIHHKFNVNVKGSFAVRHVFR